MKKKKLRINKCANGHYTLENVCPQCGQQTYKAAPPKYSPSDRYGKQRRKMLYSGLSSCQAKEETPGKEIIKK